VDEPEFWGRLEYRICAEFRGMDDDHLRFLWCDGLTPEGYDQHGEDGKVTGRAWIGRAGSGQECWVFTLIARHVRDRQDIDWRELLPADRLTGWLIPDLVSKTLIIDPAAGSGWSPHRSG
jgi:hypothetical protein